MAPRSKEQQEAYNKKRRQESAAKKAGALIGTAPAPKAVVAKAVNTAAKMVSKAKPTLKQMEQAMNKATIKQLDEAQTKPKRKANPEKLSREKHHAKFTAKKPGTPFIKGVDVDHVVPGKVATKVRVAKETAKPEPKAKTTTLTKPKADVANLIGTAVPVVHTMARSYLRNGEPGAGMKRGANYQATVTFTEDQFMQLRDKAGFNNRSMAEQIRWCCIQQLKA